MWASLLDALILIVPVIVLVVLIVAVFAAGSNVGGIALVGITVGIYALAALFYAPLLMARPGANNGQTWGKQIAGITVVRDGGEPVGFGFAFVREFLVKNLLIGWAGGLLFSIPSLLNYLWPLWDDQNRCLHDMIVSTHVVRR